MAFIAVIPIVACVIIYRRWYEKRMRALGAAVVTEAEYVSRHYPQAYPAYFRKAKSALEKHGVGDLVSHLPNK